MRGPFVRLKGPFTPSQWMELERQVLIYKHIMANVPIPSNLLVPGSSPLNPYASSGSYSSNFRKLLFLDVCIHTTALSLLTWLSNWNLLSPAT